MSLDEQKMRFLYNNFYFGRHLPAVVIALDAPTFGIYERADGDGESTWLLCGESTPRDATRRLAHRW